MTKSIEISADDFGISRVANERILALVSVKKVDRVSVMADGEMSREEIEMLILSGVRLDLHLDVEKRDVGERKLKEKIVSRVAVFFWYFLSGRYSTKNVERMWDEQILRFRELFGRFPDGLNTHQHIHFFPPFFSVLAKLSQKYALSSVRFGTRASKKRNGIAVILDRLRLLNAKTFEQSGCKTRDLLISADWISGFDISKIEEDLLADESAEVIFHPERDEEYAYLCELEVK